MRRWTMSGLGVLLSLGITAAMSWLFHREVRADMLVTGLVCAVLVDLAISRITRRYRRALREANQRLEQRVAERTEALTEAYERLEAASSQRLELQEKLSVLDRQATAGAMAAGVCHEINNPLAGLLGNLELARESLDDPDELTRCIDDALLGAEQVAAVARDLARLSKPVDDPAAPLHLADVVDGALRMTADELRRTVHLDVELPDELPAVLASRSRLTQVLINLLINAAKATDPTRPNHLHVSASTTADRAHLVVRDTGIGMTPEVVERLFEPFFTTRGDRGGTGLGMYVCRQIVEQVGGRIDVDSTPGEGTTFTVVLPIVAPVVRPRAVAEGSLGAAFSP